MEGFANSVCYLQSARLRWSLERLSPNHSLTLRRLQKSLMSISMVKNFYKQAVERAMIFQQIQNKTMLSIDRQLSIQRTAAVQNRAKLRSIVETIIFCGRQGLSLRGHRDDHTSVNADPLANHGNFLALLQFRIQAGDTVLSQHLQTAACNAVYTSKTTHNEIIAICGDLIRKEILDNIKEAPFFSIMADEATDSQ